MRTAVSKVDWMIVATVYFNMVKRIMLLSTGVRRALIKRGDWPDGLERHGFESLGDYQTIWPRRINGGAPVSKTG